ncbi:UPF0687 protein C20orf27 homolog isoform X3 [Carcharodon carcharias]|uniref:UPF0687 protein C20orf27 homolog isoform X3 n=1 Tax=Carcharodon carcharias TaxID=13397 RepID=UPI001B7E90B8|nr:UPF0687 protein C20orf27 homolog isoform X3 [Carcharodon carcharias]
METFDRAAKGPLTLGRNFQLSSQTHKSENRAQSRNASNNSANEGVGFLKISHKYEITFLLPDNKSLRQETSCAPVPNLYLKLVDIAPVTEGYRVKCEYIAHKEGVIREEMIMTNKINNNASVKVTLQARVLDRLHGTPMLLEGVKCIGSEPEYDSEQSDWQGFD